MTEKKKPEENSSLVPLSNATISRYGAREHPSPVGPGTADDLVQALPEAESLSEGAKKGLRKAVDNLKHGLYASVPLLCRMERCPYAEVCPVYQLEEMSISARAAMNGRPCPVEQFMINQWYDWYITSLDIDPEKAEEVSLVKDLVQAEIQDLRVSRIDALKHFITNQTVGVDPRTGRILTQEVLSPHVLFQDKVKNRKYQILKMLNATRRSQKDSVPVESITAMVAALRRKEEETQKRHLNKMKNIEDAEYRVVENQEKPAQPEE